MSSCIKATWRQEWSGLAMRLARLDCGNWQVSKEKVMSIEAMKLALDALEKSLPFAEIRDFSDWGTKKAEANESQTEAITALRQAIEQQEQDWSIEEAALASLREHMREIKQLRAALEQAGHIPDATKMMQEPDVYGDGNVYRGQRSKDSTTKTLHYTAQPVAWRTFDGEGNYEFRDYEMNENYKDEWDKRNPKHQGWVEPLYTEPPKREWVGLGHSLCATPVSIQSRVTYEGEVLSFHKMTLEELELQKKRPWVGLTDEEIDLAIKDCKTTNTYKYFRAIEAKLKEKNT